MSLNLIWIAEMSYFNIWHILVEWHFSHVKRVTCFIYVGILRALDGYQHLMKKYMLF